MAELKEASVPDIGGYDDVPVIEVLVAVGDTVAKDQGLVTLESDKATMEVPAPFAGVVKELKVKVGDAVSEGSVVAMIEAEGDAGAADVGAAEAAKKPAAESPPPTSPLLKSAPPRPRPRFRRLHRRAAWPPTHRSSRLRLRCGSRPMR